MSKKTPTPDTTDISSAVSDAYSGMDELKDELQNWLDNMPESLQNGSKADELNEAIDAISNVDEITVPDCLENGKDVPSVTYYTSKKSSRSGRRDTLTSMLSGAADAGREYIQTLSELDYDEETGVLKMPEGMTEDERADWSSGLPDTADDRDSWVTEIEEFIESCENAQSEYDEVNFPGMR
jgi:dsDNA-binding SOS-regulon protein